jgi:hypothetical protein
MSSVFWVKHATKILFSAWFQNFRLHCNILRPEGCFFLNEIFEQSCV